MGASAAVKPKNLADENRRLKELLAEAIAWRGAPLMIVSDNGAELTHAVFDWTKPHGHGPALHRAGEPQQNAVVECPLQDECPNEELFRSVAEARAAIESWRHDDNTAGPHSAHGGLTPRRGAKPRRRPTGFDQ
jgi:putative transposase